MEETLSPQGIIIEAVLMRSHSATSRPFSFYRAKNYKQNKMP
jgi:hypothetical protein